MKKQTQKRAYNIYQNGKLLKVVGGTSAGRFYSTNTMSTKRPKNRTRGITVRKVVQAGCIGFLVLMWVLCSQANKPIVKVDQAQAVDLMFHGDESVPAEGSFESADMPRDAIARDRVETPKEVIKRIFGKDADNANKIADCESHFNTLAHNYNPKTKDDSYGLFQVNLWGNMKNTRPAPEVLKTVEGNVQFAKVLFDSAGQTWSSNWKVCSRINGLK